MKKHLLAVAIAGAALMASAGAQAAVVDLFSTDQASLNNYTDGTVIGSQVSSFGGDILGNYRDLQAYQISGGVSGVAGTSIAVASGNLYFSTDASVNGQGAVMWDGSTAATNTVAGFGIPNYTGLGGIDLTNGGALSAFQLTTIFADQTWWFTLYMYTDATHWTSVQLESTPVATPTDEIVPFSAFTNGLLCGTTGAAPGVGDIMCGAGGTADSTNVGALAAILNTGSTLTTSIDLQLTSATTIPEPGTLALFGVGLLGMGLARRRRRRQS